MNNKKLEVYLTRLEKALGPISASEKAEIIIEIKSHILDSLESSDKTIDKILTGLGEPEQVANKYLIDRGLEPQKTPKHPIVKWITIGFLGTTAILSIILIVLIWKFSPVIQIGKNGIHLLGGAISIGKNEYSLDSGIEIGEDGIRLNGITVKDNKDNLTNIISKNLMEDMFFGKVNKTVDITRLKTSKLILDFSNAYLIIKNSENNKIKYSCKYIGRPSIKEGTTFYFDFKNSNAKCRIFIPKHLNIDISAHNARVILKKLENDMKIAINNAKIEFKEVKANIDVDVNNGKISFIPAQNTPYNYDLSVNTGRVASFKSSNDPKAYKVKMSVKNGMISN